MKRLFSLARYQNRLKPVQIRKRDFIPAMALVIGTMGAVLLAWTVMQPLTLTRVIVQYYERRGDTSTIRFARDAINTTASGRIIEERDVIESYGVCSSPNASSFLFPLMLAQFCFLVAGNILGYQIRKIPVMYAETKWITVSFCSFVVKPCVIRVAYVCRRP